MFLTSIRRSHPRHRVVVWIAVWILLSLFCGSCATRDPRDRFKQDLTAAIEQMLQPLAFRHSGMSPGVNYVDGEVRFDAPNLAAGCGLSAPRQIGVEMGEGLIQLAHTAA